MPLLYFTKFQLSRLYVIACLHTLVFGKASIDEKLFLMMTESDESDFEIVPPGHPYSIFLKRGISVGASPAVVRDDSKTDPAVPSRKKVDSGLNRTGWDYCFPCVQSSQQILLLRPGEKISVTGSFKFQVFFGTATVFGITQTGGPVSGDKWVLASSSMKVSVQPLTFCCPLSAESSIQHPKLSRLRWRLRELCEEDVVKMILRTFQPGSAAVVLSKCYSRPGNVARKVCRDLFYHGLRVKGRTRGEKYCTEVGVYPSDSVCDWSEYLSDEIVDLVYKGANSRSVVVVMGPMNSGKSTLCRQLINRGFTTGKKISPLLPVYHLETDVGQSEFTPSGCVSLVRITEPLLSIPFLDQKEPIRSFFLGGVSPADHKDLYLSCIKTLLEDYKKVSEEKSVLVINTHGWTTGQGIPLLHKILDVCQPNFVFHITSQNETTNGSDEKLFCPENLPELKRFWDFPAANVNPKAFHLYTSQTRRSLSLIFALSKILPSSEPSSLLSVVPFRTKLANISLWFVEGDMVPDSQILSVLNANVVALCSVPEARAGEHLFGDETMPRLIRNHSIQLRFHGFGILRCFDMEEKDVLLLSHLTEEELDGVNVLAKGRMELPEIFLQSQAPYTAFMSASPIRRKRGLEKEGSKERQLQEGNALAQETKRKKKKKKKSLASPSSRNNVPIETEEDGKLSQSDAAVPPKNASESDLVTLDED